MKIIILSIIASLALVSPAMGQTASRTAPFSEVIEKVEALATAHKAAEVANQVRLELAKGTKKKTVLAKL